MSGLKTHSGPPPFKWSHLWEPAIINPVNRKSYTIPFFNLLDPYARAFHLSWLAFFVAFTSWFAFPPLIPEAIKSDLKLTTAQVANSNVIALTSTMFVRFLVGPLIDRYGPKKVMAGLLIAGAIPSGLAGTATGPKSLYVLRFFIGILGGTFAPAQAWTSVFFDKNCVGTANALVGGWGNMGGGATFAIMTTLFQSLVHSRGLSVHVAWRAAFALVPVPILLFVAILTIVFGPDHPNGKWSERHNMPATAIAIQNGHEAMFDQHGRLALKPDDKEKDQDKEKAMVTVEQVAIDETLVESTVDVAVNEPLTLKTVAKIATNPLTWLPSFAYLTTFGAELALDSQMAGMLFTLFSKRIHGFNQVSAGYYTAIFGLLNLFTRPFGGYLGDVVYRRYGTPGKKYWTLLSGLLMGVSFIAGGVYLQQHEGAHKPELPIIMGVFSLAAIFSEFGNGANFALVPHCNAYNNGVMSGLVGSFGNLGGIIFTLIFRFETDAGRAYWIIGLICTVINLALVIIPVPKK